MKAIRVFLPLFLCFFLSSQYLAAQPPGTPLYHFDAGGDGVVESGGTVTGWADETGQLGPGTNGGGATASTVDFPNGTFPTVHLDGGHYANNAGFNYGPQAATEFTGMDDLAIFCVVAPGDQASRILVGNFHSGTGFGFGISDGIANSMKFWTSAGGASLESGAQDYTPGNPITVAAIWAGLGDNRGEKVTYVNGTAIASNIDPNVPQEPSYNGNNDFRIGAGSTLVQDFNGHIAEVLVYQDAGVRAAVENYFAEKYFRAPSSPPPGAPLYHFDAAGSGVVESGGSVVGWADETGLLGPGTNGGGATASSFGFPNGSFPTVELDGGHYSNNAGFNYGPQAATEFTGMDEFAMFAVVVPADQASRILIGNFHSGTGFGFGISDGIANSMKFWTSTGADSLESGVSDYVPGTPITVAGIWDGLGDNRGEKFTYVNGVEIAARIDPAVPEQPGFNGNNDFRIGAGSTLVQDFAGHIAEVLIYQDASVRTDVEEYFRAKYFVAPVPGTPLMHLDAGGSGVVSSGGDVSDWNDETGTFSSGGSNGGGATLNSFDFPAGTFPTVDLDGGHYTNNAGFAYDNDELTSFTTNDDLAIYVVTIPRDQQSRLLVTNFSGGSGYGFGISDGVANSMKFWTSGPSLETGVADYTPGRPVILGATWRGLGDGNGEKKTFVDGIEIASAINAQPGHNNPQLRVGSGAGLVQDWNGQIAEVLVYTDASESRRLQVEGYFSAKYGLLPDVFKVFHLDAANATGGAWNDETGNFSSDGVRGDPTPGTHDFPTGTLPVVDFDGDDGFTMDNDSGLHLNEQFVIHAVIVPDGGNQSQIILSNYRDSCGFGFGFSDARANTIKHFTANPVNSLETGEDDTVGGIHAIVTAIYANGDKRTLINGMEVASSSPGAIDFACGAELTVGNLDFGRQFFTGGIAEICVWNGVNGDTVDAEINRLKSKYGVEIGGALCSELPAPPAGSLARFCAGGDGVSLDGDLLTAWDDENGVFMSEGFAGGGTLTVAAAAFPAGPRRVVNFPGSVGIKLDNDQEAELTVMTISAVIIHGAGGAQQIINTYENVCGYGLGISDGRAHDIKHFTGGAAGHESLESIDGEEDVPAGVPSHVLATYDDRSGNLVKEYFVNGVSKGRSDPSNGNLDYLCGVADRLEIGMLFAGGAQFFNGQMAEILIYPDTSEQLTGEINAYVEAAYGIEHTSGPEGPIVAHWAADQGVTTDGDGVQMWEDLAGGDNNAFREPTFGPGQAQLGTATFPSGERPVIVMDGEMGFGVENQEGMNVDDVTILAVFEINENAGTVVSNYTNVINWGYGYIFRSGALPEAASTQANLFTSNGTCGTISDPFTAAGTIPQGWQVLEAQAANSEGRKRILVNGDVVADWELGNLDPANPCPGIDGSERAAEFGYDATNRFAIGSFLNFGANREHGAGVAELMILNTTDPAVVGPLRQALLTKYFSAVRMTAGTFWGSDSAAENGQVNNGKRWNTLSPHPAWELYFGAGDPENGDHLAATSSLNKLSDCAIDIGLVEGDNTFWFTVAGFGLVRNGMNLWFNDQNVPDDSPPGISVFGGNNAGPGSFAAVPEGIETMGYPLNGIGSSGSLSWFDPGSGATVTLTEWYVDGAEDPGGEGNAADLVTAGGGQVCGDQVPNPDGIDDLVGKLVLNLTFGAPTICVEPGGSINDAIAAAEPGATVELKPGVHEGGRILVNKNITLSGAGNGGASGGSAVIVEWPSTQDWEATVQPGVAALYENATSVINNIHFRIDVSGTSPSTAGGFQIAKIAGPPGGDVTFNNCIFEYTGTAPADVNVFNRNMIRIEGGNSLTLNNCEVRWSNEPVAFPSFVNNIGHFTPGGEVLTVNANDCIFDNVTDTNGRMRTFGSGGGGGGTVNVNLNNCSFNEDEHGGLTRQQAWLSPATAGTTYNVNFCDFFGGADRKLGQEGNPNVRTNLNGCIFHDAGGDSILPDPGAQGNIVAENSVFLNGAGGKFRSAVFCCENEPRSYVFRHCTFQDNDNEVLFTAPNAAHATEFSNCLFNMPNADNITTLFGGLSMAPVGATNMSNGGGGGDEATPDLTIVADLLLDADGYHITECSPALGAGTAGGFPPTPPDAGDPTLAGWWRADELSGAAGDSVSSWADASSNGTTLEPRVLNNAGDPADEAPSLVDGAFPGNPNEVLVANFDRAGPAATPGNSDRLYQANNLGAGDPLDIGNGSGLSLIMLYRPDVTTSGALGFQSVAAKRGTGSSVFSYQINPAGVPLYVTYDATTAYFADAAIADSVWHVAAMTIEEAGADDTLRFFDSTSQDTAQTLIPAGTLSIGGRNPTTPEAFALAGHSQACCGEGETFDGAIAEVIVYNRTLTPGELQGVATYLGNKYFAAGGGGFTPPPVVNDVDGEGRASVVDIGADERPEDSPASAGTIFVAGGGSALQDAIDAAGACTTDIIVEDSLDYSPVGLGKTLNISAAAGQTPRVVADDSTNGTALSVFDGGRSASWDGIDIVQVTESGFGGDPGHNVLIVNQGGDGGTVFNLSNATVEVIDNSGIGSVDGRVAGIGDTVNATNCTFRRADANGNPCLILFDQAGGSSFNNCQVGPTNDGNVIALVFNGDDQENSDDVTFNDCTVSGYPAGQRAMFNGDARRDVFLNGCVFDGRLEFAGDARAIGGTVTADSCIIGGGGGEAIFAGDNSGRTYSFTNCILLGGDNDQFAFSSSNGGVNRGNHNWNLTNCTVLPSAAFPRGNFRFLFLEGDNSTNLVQANTVVTLNNNIFANPAGNISAVFDNGVPTSPAVSTGTNLWDGTVDGNDAAFGAGGTDINASAGLDANGRLTADSGAAINAATDEGLTADVDGDSRPSATEGCPPNVAAASDLGADEYQSDDVVCDDEAPMITCSGDVSVAGCDENDQAVVNYDAPTVSDNLSAEEDIVVSCDIPSGSTFDEGDTTVTCTATDEAGNSAQCSFTVSVDCGGLVRPGDMNGDGTNDQTDQLNLLELLFLGLHGFPCGSDAANTAVLDANGDGRLDQSDAVYNLIAIFLGGPGHALGADCVKVVDCADSCTP